MNNNNSTFKLTLLTVLSLFSVSFSLFSQPHLTELSPAKIYVQSDFGIKFSFIPLTIKGQNLLKPDMTGYTHSDRVKLFFKKGDQIAVQFKTYGYSLNDVTTNFVIEEWLDITTPLGVYMEVDGIRSNTLFFTLMERPKTPPVIDRITPSSITVNSNPTDIYITGSLLGGSKVKINGIDCSIGPLDFLESYLYVKLPAELLSKPGKYPVVVQSLYGNSNISYFTVDRPLIKMAPVPKAPVVNPESKDRDPLKKAEVKPPEIKKTGNQR